MDLDITSPLRTAADVENAVAKKRSRPDLGPGVQRHRGPAQSLVQHGQGCRRPRGAGHPQSLHRPQQAPAVYDVNASIYVFQRDFLANNTDGMLWSGKIGVSVMMDTGIIDIDSEADYLLMEAIGAHLYAHKPEFAAVRDNIRG